LISLPEPVNYAGMSSSNFRVMASSLVLLGLSVLLVSPAGFRSFSTAGFASFSTAGFASFSTAGFASFSTAGFASFSTAGFAQEGQNKDEPPELPDDPVEAPEKAEKAEKPKVEERPDVPVDDDVIPEDDALDDDEIITSSDDFNLFPLYSKTRDLADGSDFEQFLWFYWHWRNPTPKRTVEESTLVMPITPLPFFYSHEEEENWFQMFFPFYFSRGRPDDHWTVGFPLYWQAHEQETPEDSGEGWSVLLPFYWHLYSPTDVDRFIIPFYGYRSFPGEQQHSILGPLYVYQRYENVEGEQIGSAHNIAWPLITVGHREEAFDYRLLPFFWVARADDSADTLITPFYYSGHDTGGSLSYVFPFYARSESIGVRDDHYGMGLYTRGRAVDDEGTLLRSRDHVLWGLGAWENDVRAGTKHSRFLPVGYFSTETPNASRALFGPFYYSHSETDESDNRWSLDLLLGNLWVSSVVEGPPEYTPTSSSIRDDHSVPTNATPVGAAGPAGPAGQDEPSAGTYTVGEESVQARRVDPPSTDDGSLYPLRVERSSDKGIVWPLIRWYRNDRGYEGHWAAPFYFDTKSDSSEKLAFFPVSYTQEDAGPYELNYFRYFFLFNQERWATGSRLSIGQFVFDWKEEATENRTEVSLLFPLTEFYGSENGFGYQFFNLLAGSDETKGGEREVDYHLFPIFWYGYHERQNTSGEWARQHGHFYLLPMMGYEGTTTRHDYYALYPLIHLRNATDSTEFQMWPFIFWADHPTLQAVRLWPLHSSEAGEQAGDKGWTDWLFLSKYAYKPSQFSYRLDPFLYSYESDTEDGSSALSLLFGIYQQETAGADTRHTLFWFLSF